MVEGLTAHHRVHGMHMRLRVETLAGRWDAVRPLTSAAERAVEANATTPCTGNAGALLCCAIASAQFGDSAEARRLKGHADAIAIEGETELETLFLWLALVQHDLGELRRLADTSGPVAFAPWEFDRAAALLDALVALGDHARIESDAPAWLRPGTYIEPFALRALGVTRQDEQLVGQAATRFAAMDLHWQAAETRKLLS
jgi:hypothetical protein